MGVNQGGGIRVPLAEVEIFGGKTVKNRQVQRPVFFWAYNRLGLKSVRLPRDVEADIHLGHGQFQRSLAAQALLQKPGIKSSQANRQTANLGYPESHFADPRPDTLVLEPITASDPVDAAFAGAGSQELGPLDLHRFIQKQGNCIGHSVKSLLHQGFHHTGNRGIFWTVGNG